ncbi:hypothetical protein EG68_01148 [Paragonimus skrjabini miyazakii]|uniref:C2H2-type domain-containing protein n=1 Tax=Paragonimus skrjabini miyazakii TaxID=59628 RepID=A0A8S9Z4B2_9TREM|nr:hypothetical protein EG68_01148 [Paragonimus skrjabini miyazakii]
MAAGFNPGHLPCSSVGSGHLPDRPFLCGCGKSYTRVQHLRRHQSVCIGVEPARNSSSHFGRPEDLPSSPKRLYPCAQCDAGPFRKKKTVWAHVAMVHRRPSVLREHELTHTPGNPAIRRLFVCPLCETPDGQSATVAPSGQRVVADVNPNVAAFTLKRNLHAHIRSVHVNLVYPCTWPGCPVLLSTKQKLNEHMERHEKNRPVAHHTRPRRRRASAQDSHGNAKPIRRVKKAVAKEEDIETASQSSIVALLMDSSEEHSAQVGFPRDFHGLVRSTLFGLHSECIVVNMRSTITV